MKNFTMFFFLLFTITFAQERMILKSNGEQIKLNHKKDLREAITESQIKRSDGKCISPSCSSCCRRKNRKQLGRNLN